MGYLKKYNFLAQQCVTGSVTCGNRSQLSKLMVQISTGYIL